MKKLILTTLFGAAMCGSALADEWLALGVTDGGKEWQFLNLETIECEEKICSTWGGVINIDPAKKFDTELVYYQYDCKRKMVKPIASVQYLREKIVNSIDFSNKYRPVVPGSVSAGHLKYVCGLKKATDEDIVLVKSLAQMAKDIQPIMRRTKK